MLEAPELHCELRLLREGPVLGEGRILLERPEQLLLLDQRPVADGACRLQNGLAPVGVGRGHIHVGAGRLLALERFKFFCGVEAQLPRGRPQEAVGPRKSFINWPFSRPANRCFFLEHVEPDVVAEVRAHGRE